MALTVQAILTRVQNVLNDSGADHWSQAELFDWVNDAVREVVYTSPESNATVANLTLVAGTKQTLPAGAIDLIEITRNMGSGATPGEAPRETTLSLMNTQFPTWHAVTATTTVKNYMRDPRIPRTFYVYPPVSGSTVVVEAIYSLLPSPITATGDAVPLPDFYLNALVEYVLYRAFSKEVEIPNIRSKADEHRTNFMAALQQAQQGEAQSQ